jgi:hypothetical protein
MILIERLERKKVNMKKENKLCGNDYMLCFNALIYIYRVIILKCNLTKVLKCDIRKLDCKVKK